MLRGVAMLNVTLFGGASFSVNGEPVKSDLGSAGRLLACYLFEFSSRTHRREGLADLFWGGSEPDKARSALNTAIWRIRKIMELGSKGAARHLITNGNYVLFEQCQSVQVDTHQLENASKRVLGRSDGSALTSMDQRDVSTALDGYGGPFLDGYDDDWVLQERERLHCLFVRSVFELMRVAATQKNYEAALDLGRRILSMDALRENVQRDVMLLLVLNGQRVEAVRSYQRLTSLLRSELNIDPMPETKRLYNEILSGDIFLRIDEHAIAHFGIHKA
jgi:DNA-binding SARP family transcriptional activator